MTENFNIIRLNKFEFYSALSINMLGKYDFSEEKMKDSCSILPTEITT